MKYLVLLTVLTSILACSFAVNVKSCSSSQRIPKNVIIPGCEKSPCKVKKGTELSVEIHFTTGESTKTLEPKVFGKVFGMKIPLNIPSNQQNACLHLKNAQCPLGVNQDVIYYVEMPILKSYPAMKTEIEVNLIGDNKKSILCFKIAGQIIN